jgi:hypothetical protein
MYGSEGVRKGKVDEDGLVVEGEGEIEEEVEDEPEGRGVRVEVEGGRHGNERRADDVLFKMSDQSINLPQFHYPESV